MVDSLGNNWFFLSVMWVLGTELVKVIRCAGKCLISRANLLTLSQLWSAFYFFNPCHSLELMSSSTFPHFVLLILSSRSKSLLPDHPAGSLSFSVVCSIPCAALLSLEWSLFFVTLTFLIHCALQRQFLVCHFPGPPTLWSLFPLMTQVINCSSCQELLQLIPLSHHVIAISFSNFYTYNQFVTLYF